MAQLERVSALPAPQPRGGKGAPDVAALCSSHAGLPRDVARWTAARLPPHVTADDLEPAAWEGLHDAAVSWCPDQGPFWPWARRRITAAIIADLRATDPQSKSWRARDNTIARARHDLTGRLGRTPTDAETAHAAGITLDALDRHRRARIRTTPLDDADMHADVWLRDPTPTADERAAEHPDLAGWVRAAVIALPDRQRGIIRGLYWGGQTTTAIAGVLGVHPSRVSQIHAVAVGMIRDALAWHLDGDPGPDLPPVLTRRRDAYRHAVAYTHDLHRD